MICIFLDEQPTRVRITHLTVAKVVEAFKGLINSYFWLTYIVVKTVRCCENVKYPAHYEDLITQASSSKRLREKRSEGRKDVGKEGRKEGV